MLSETLGRIFSRFNRAKRSDRKKCWSSDHLEKRELLSANVIHVTGTANISAFRYSGGAFGTELRSTVGVSEKEFAGMGDVDGDGDLDIIAKYEGLRQTTGFGSFPGQWRVYINNGSDLFTSSTTWDSNVPLSNTGGSFSWVDHQIADFTGDGKADVLARMADTGEWNLWTSTGSGFVKSVWGTWNLGQEWRDAMVGDFNGDGIMDLVGRRTANVPASGVFDDWYVGLGSSTSQNRGTVGAGGSTWWYYTKGNSTSVVANTIVGDFNGDGKDDLASRYLLSTASNGSRTSQWWVSTTGATNAFVFASSAWTNWDHATTGGYQTRWKDIQAVDVNGDGKDDVIGRTVDGRWWLSLGGGTGATLVADLAGTAYEDNTAIFGDFTGPGGTPDGKAELVIRDSVNDRWLLAQYNGSTFGTLTAVGGASSGSPLMGNPVQQSTHVNGSTSGYGSYTAYQRSLPQLAENDALSLSESRAHSISNGSGATAGDPRLTLGRYKADGSFDFENFGGLSISSQVSSESGKGLFAADFNGDGLLDVLARDLDPNATPGTWYLATNLGNAYSTSVVSLPTSFAGSSYVDFRVGDYTGDGKADLLAMVANTNPATGHWDLFVSTGTNFNSGVTVATTPVIAGSGWITGGISGDFDGDLKDDFVFTKLSSTPNTYDTFVAYSNGTSAWQVVKKWTRATTSNVILHFPETYYRVGDFNGDGRDDITALQNVQTSPGVWTGQITTGLSSASRTAAFSGWATNVSQPWNTNGSNDQEIFEVGRFAGLDTNADVVVRIGSQLQVWQSSGSNFGTSPAFVGADPGYYDLTHAPFVSDIDRDGYDDLVWQHGDGLQADYRVTLMLRSTTYSFNNPDTGFNPSGSQGENTVDTTIRRLRRRRG